VADSEFHIRPGRRDDAAAAARLWMQSAEEHASYDTVYDVSPGAEYTMRRFLAEMAVGGNSFLLVAVSGDEVVGFISGELREGSPTFRSKIWASVDDVFVAPDHRSLGIGHALVARVALWAREQRANGVSLQVAAANGRARKFYDELGFREVSVYEVLEF
jgi:GNAT superfamily N-acetyltransferase